MAATDAEPVLPRLEHLSVWHSALCFPIFKVRTLIILTLQDPYGNSGS